MSYCKICRNNRVITVVSRPHDDNKISKPKRVALDCPICSAKEKQLRQEIMVWNAQVDAGKRDKCPK